MKTETEQLSEKDQRIGMKIYYRNLLEEMEKKPRAVYSRAEVLDLLREIHGVTDMELQTIDS